MVDLSNRLLTLLPRPTKAALVPLLELVQLEPGVLLYKEFVEQKYVYFPTFGIVSFLHVMQSGASAEIGLVGNDGLVGLAPVLGGRAASGRAVVQVAGAAWRMEASALRARILLDKRLGALLAQYAQVFLAQVSQTAVCNRAHNVEQQFCRWMLMSLDRLQDENFRMTQKLIADMLGARREAVSIVATRLRKKGAIEYIRGVITVVDRNTLEKSSCECYAELNAETERLLRLS